MVLAEARRSWTGDATDEAASREELKETPVVMLSGAVVNAIPIAHDVRVTVAVTCAMALSAARNASSMPCRSKWAERANENNVHRSRSFHAPGRG